MLAAILNGAELAEGVRRFHELHEADEHGVLEGGVVRNVMAFEDKVLTAMWISRIKAAVDAPSCHASRLLRQRFKLCCQ